MKTINIGTIIQDPASGYRVTMFKFEKIREFEEIDDAFDYVKNHALGILKTNRLSAVSIKLIRSDERISYLIWERNIDQKKFNYMEYELTEFDYVHSHKGFFSKAKTKTVVNERYYSFNDFARLESLDKKVWNFIKIVLNTSMLIFSIAFLLYGLHTFNLSNHIEVLSRDKRYWFNTLLSISFVVVFIVSISSLTASFYPIYKIRTLNYDYDKVDWWKIRHIRKRAKKISLIMSIIGFVTFSLFFVFFAQSPLNFHTKGIDNEPYVMLWMAIAISIAFTISSFDQIIHTISNKFFVSLRMHKYYTNDEIDVYKKWVKHKNERNIYKTDKDFFYFDFDQQNELVLGKIMIFNEVYRTLTLGEVKKIIKKAKTHYQEALDIYRKTPNYQEH